MLSILIDEQKNVNKEIKDHICESIWLKYDIPDSETLKNKTWSYCTEHWRKFKTNLSKKYVHIEVKDGQPRPNPYNKCVCVCVCVDENSW